MKIAPKNQVATTPAKLIDPDQALPAISGQRGVLFDVRDRDGPILAVSHFPVSLSEIEQFMSGELSGERVRALVSTLVFLASKWREVYIVADSDSAGMLAMSHLEKLGFRDTRLVLGGVAALPLSVGRGATTALTRGHGA